MRLIWLPAGFIMGHLPADCLSGVKIVLFLSVLQSAPGSFKRFVEASVTRVSRRERPQNKRVTAARELIGLFGKLHRFTRIPNRSLRVIGEYP